MATPRQFRGKTAIVTGGGSGIGRALSLELATAGANVAVTDIRPDRLDAVVPEIEARGVKAKGYPLDHTRLDDVVEFKEAFFADWGHVDVLCLNAGVAISSEVVDTTLEDWKWVMDVNVWGTVYMIQCFLPALVEQNSGHILITASLAGLVGLPTTGAYSASKFALVGLAESMRAELGQHNIVVSALCPGIVKTNLIKDGRVTLRTRRLGADTLNDLWQRIGESPGTVARRAVRGQGNDVPVIASSFAYVTVPWTAKKLFGRLLNSGIRLAWRQKHRLESPRGR